jgi:hypothetical protein
MMQPHHSRAPLHTCTFNRATTQTKQIGPLPFARGEGSKRQHPKNSLNSDSDIRPRLLVYVQQERAHLTTTRQRVSWGGGGVGG